MKIYKTTLDNYIVEDGEEMERLNTTGNLYNGTEDDFGEKSSALRAGSKNFNTIKEAYNKMKSKKMGFSIIDNIGGNDILLSTENFEMFINLNGEVLPFTAERAKALKESYKELSIAKISTTDTYKLGDRALLF